MLLKDIKAGEKIIVEGKTMKVTDEFEEINDERIVKCIDSLGNTHSLSENAIVESINAKKIEYELLKIKLTFWGLLERQNQYLNKQIKAIEFTMHEGKNTKSIGDVSIKGNPKKTDSKVIELTSAQKEIEDKIRENIKIQIEVMQNVNLLLLSYNEMELIHKIYLYDKSFNDIVIENPEQYPTKNVVFDKHKEALNKLLKGIRDYYK